MSFADLAREPDPPLDRLALALAGEFRPVDEDGALRRLDELAADVAARLAPGADPEQQLALLGDVLGGRHGFCGDAEHYDEPDNSFLDHALTERTGLPITLSVLYVAVARRAGIALVGVGLPGHYVAGHGATRPPLLIDPFGGGGRVTSDAPEHLVRPWGAHETALRMLTNLVASYAARGRLAAAIHAADLRLVLPAATQEEHQRLNVEARALRARLN
jgi:regulator of sirC expression with transglutaminase-like and TPR domain